MNILILENNQEHAFIIYQSLQEGYTNIECYPRINYIEKESVMMSQFLKECLKYSQNSSELSKKEELMRFIKEDVLNGCTPDLFIIDVSLKEAELQRDETGAFVRKHILSELFPNTPAIFCTMYATNENYSQYILRGDRDISKNEMGVRNFKDNFIDGFEKIRKEENFPIQRSRKFGRYPKLINGVIEYIIRVTRLIKNDAISYFAKLIANTIAFFILLSCVCFMFIFCVAIYKIIFNTNAVAELRQIVEKLLQGIEIMFIGVLPLNIMTSFYLYYKNITLPYINPDLLDNLANRKKKEAHYYLNLSKILFISTLLSLVATKFLESVNFENTKSYRQIQPVELVSTFVFFILLLFFYWLIEKNLHSISKEIDRTQKEMK